MLYEVITAAHPGAGTLNARIKAVRMSFMNELMNTFNACFMLGAWCNPVMFTLAVDEMGHLFKDAMPKVVITQESFVNHVKEAMTRASSIGALVTVDEQPIENAICMQDWFKNLPTQFPIVSCQPDDRNNFV